MFAGFTTVPSLQQQNNDREKKKKKKKKRVNRHADRRQQEQASRDMLMSRRLRPLRHFQRFVWLKRYSSETSDCPQIRQAWSLTKRGGSASSPSETTKPSEDSTQIMCEVSCYVSRLQLQLLVCVFAKTTSLIGYTRLITICNKNASLPWATLLLLSPDPIFERNCK